MRTETVEEFLKRGGKIIKLEFGYLQMYYFPNSITMKISQESKNE